MAKIANSTPTPTRRTIGAGLFAIVAGSGITSGFAASVADLVPTDPDADLIALCRNAILADQRSNALIERFSTMLPSDPRFRQHADAAFEAASKIVFEEWHPAIQRASETPARTRAGIEAKAKLLLAAIDDPTGEDALAASLAQDVLAGRR